MNENNISKLNLHFIYENKSYDIPLFASQFKKDAQKITIKGREYTYEENAKIPIPESLLQCLKSLPDDKKFANEKEFLSMVSNETHIEHMSLTKNVYSVGINRLVKSKNIDTAQLERLKNNLSGALSVCKPDDKKALLNILSHWELPINRIKAFFEIAEQIEIKYNNFELAHAIREAVRPFDLNPTISSIQELISHSHVDVETSKQIAENLQKLLDSGKYEKLYDPMDFVNELTIDLREIGNDKQLAVHYQHADSEIENLQETKVHVETKKNGICYFEITKFENPKDILALKRVKQALAQIRNSHPKAIIIDLRNNGGGSPYMMVYIASHFMKPDIPLAEYQYRHSIEKEELEYFPTEPCISLSEEELPLEERMLSQPIYILTSDHTLAIAEALTYHLQEHREAKVAGEKSGGVAHLTKLFEVNKDFDVAIPFGDYILSSGAPNWKGKGITPQIKVIPDTL